MQSWVLGPIGVNAEHRVTRAGCRTVLVMVPTTAAGHRLLDVTQLLEADHRIQVVFTVPEGTEHWQGPEDFVRARHGLLVPWPQAVQNRFDVILSASHREIDRVHGNLVVLPHGVGAGKALFHSRKAAGATIATTGFDRELLTYRGRVLPEAVVLHHDDELATLRDRCAEALPKAVVAGDICLDRMVASRQLREEYRRALGVRTGHRLITVSSTWSSSATFGRCFGLYRALLDEASPADCRVAAVLHPKAWEVHGRWQIQAWLADCVRDGLLLIPPEEGWRATMIASDWVIGDHGSTTVYPAALGIPVSLATFPDHAVRADSAAAHLADWAPRLHFDAPLLPQYAAAKARQPGSGRRLAAHVTSRPGQAAAVLRSVLYRLLDLAEPDTRGRVVPVPRPRPLPFHQ
jgi:hypothetical protein